MCMHHCCQSCAAAAPIQWSVIDGDKESGVTIMQMDKGLDTGDILLVEKYTLDPKETGGSLFDKLSGLGGPLLLQALEQAEQGTLSPGYRRSMRNIPMPKCFPKHWGRLILQRMRL